MRRASTVTKVATRLPRSLWALRALVLVAAGACGADGFSPAGAVIVAADPPGDPSALDAGAGDRAVGADRTPGPDAVAGADAWLEDDAARANAVPAPDSSVVDASVPGGDAQPWLTTCGAAGPPALADVSADALAASLASKDFVLINVASASGGQIPQTDGFAPYDDVDALVALIGPALDTAVVLYCASGGRSRAAGLSLTALGYCQISQLAGGLNAWVAAGYALE